MQKLSSSLRTISLFRKQGVTKKLNSNQILWLQLDKYNLFSILSSTSNIYSAAYFKYDYAFAQSSLHAQSIAINITNSFCSDVAKHYSRRRKKKTLEHWAQILSCDVEKVENILLEYNILERISPDWAEDKVKVFTSFNLPIKLVQEKPRIICDIPIHEFYRRLKLFQDRGLLYDLLNDQVLMKPKTFSNLLTCRNNDFENIFSKLCIKQDALKCSSRTKNLTANSLSDVVGREMSGSAETYKSFRKKKELVVWAHILSCSIEKAENIYLKYACLSRVYPYTAEDKIKIFTSFNLPIELVQERPIFFHTSNNELQRRLQLLQDRGFLHDALNDEVVIKRKNLCTYLEKQRPYFDKTFTMLCDNQDALEGCANQEEYLQFRLKCTKDMAKNLFTLPPLKKTFSNVRLKTNLDFFLCEANLTNDFILKNISLLDCGVAKLRSRLAIAKQNHSDINDRVLLRIWKMREKEFKVKYNLDKDTEMNFNELA